MNFFSAINTLTIAISHIPHPCLFLELPNQLEPQDRFFCSPCLLTFFLYFPFIKKKKNLVLWLRIFLRLYLSGFLWIFFNLAFMFYIPSISLMSAVFFYNCMFLFCSCKTFSNLCSPLIRATVKFSLAH